MKTWPVKVKMPRWGHCEVKEMTDHEAGGAMDKGVNWAPRSMGFVNLFQGKIFKGWCGVAYAKRRIVGGLKQKLPKYIRDIPI
jgi:hypothetical protein